MNGLGGNHQRRCETCGALFSPTDSRVWVCLGCKRVRDELKLPPPSDLQRQTHNRNAFLFPSQPQMPELRGRPGRTDSLLIPARFECFICGHKVRTALGLERHMERMHRTR